jgi:lysine biosynthesis protein LysW
MAIAYCLDCSGRIYLENRPWVGQDVYCERCGAELEVVQVNPLALDWTDSLPDIEPDHTGEQQIDWTPASSKRG